MKLVIQRDQADRRGVLGGHKGVDFSLSYRLQLSSDEAELVKRYKLDDHWLGTWQFNGQEVPISTVAQATRGSGMQWPSVVSLIERERELKRACRNFKTLLEVASTFGGEEIIDIQGLQAEEG
ncbi:MAG: hypothetical protein M3R63_16590 [Actinomycetota bacterium]|jgi:hypothetical protein|nr:hypothetical protein [Actinomycetota bacterium]